MSASKESMRAEWRAAGGDIHGPITETVTMPEEDYFRFRAEIEAAKRDETMVHLPPAITIPAWVLKSAEEIAFYMSTRTSGDWKLGGIQKRNDAPAIPSELPSFLRWCADELMKRDTRPGSFAQGLADSLKGRAFILDYVDRERAKESKP